MTHPMVDQLRFTRTEFVRCLAGVSQEDAVRRIGLMNCLTWFVGHLAVQESSYWVYLAQGISLHPELRDHLKSGNPDDLPSLAQIWAIWREITTAADPFLDTLTPDSLAQFFTNRGQPMAESAGTLLYRNIYHYWFHTGEAHAVRQALGHTGLPQFVGDISRAVYRPEDS